MMIRNTQEHIFNGRLERLGTIFQSFLDANEIIENSNLEAEIKMKEKEKILEARKFAFGKDFRDFPPWN